MFVLKERDNPVKSLDRGVFQRNKRRNCAGFLVILVITALVMILFIQAKNTGRTITEKAFQKTGTDAQAIFGYISEKEITAIAGHPAVKGMEVQVSEKEGGHRLTAFVYLRSDRNIKKSVDNILGDLGIKNLSWQVNPAYLSGTRTRIAQKSVLFYLGAIPVLTAGHWLLMEILRKSAVKDRPLYRQLLSLGMTKTQWSRMLQGQVDRLCLAAIPAGLLTGAWTGSILAGYYGEKIKGIYISAWNPMILAGAAVVSWITVRSACLHLNRQIEKSKKSKKQQRGNVL